MKKQFATYEIALKLKELGFDEECLAYFNSDEEFIYGLNIPNIKFVFKYNKISDSCLAPLWQQIIDWFKEEHNLFIDVYVISGFPSLKYSWDILTKDNTYRVNHFKIGSNESFYEMRAKAILKALELCQKK